MLMIIPKGPRAIPFVMILVSAICFIALLLDMNTFKKEYNPENAFYSISDDYDKTETGTRLFAIEDLTPVKIHSTSDHGQNTYCLSAFKDGTGSEHYILLNIPRSATFYNDFKDALNEDTYVISGYSLTGVFELTSMPTSDITFYGSVLDENPLKDEVHTRTVEFKPGSEDYQTFLDSNYESKMSRQVIYIVISLIVLVAGVLLWKKLSKPAY